MAPTRCGHQLGNGEADTEWSRRSPAPRNRHPRHFGRSRLALAVLLVAATLFASCGVKRLFGGKLPFEVVIDQALNRNSPIAVEMVIIYDKKLLPILLELTAEEWFGTREQYNRDFPKGFDSWSWEWVPGQEVSRKEIKFRTGAKAGLVFADYYVPGTHRQRIDPREPVLLVLGEDGFTVEPLK